MLSSLQAFLHFLSSSSSANSSSSVIGWLENYDSHRKTCSLGFPPTWANMIECTWSLTLSKHISHLMRKPTICICENKDADQLRGNREADQRLCFATRIVQFLFFLNPKFPVSSHLLCLYSPVCVGSVRKPHCWLSPRGGSYTYFPTPFLLICSLLLKDLSFIFICFYCNWCCAVWRP